MNKADIHCHLLNGVDDGSAALGESLDLLRMEEKDGVTAIILTPHLRYHMFETPYEELVRRFMLLDETREKEGITLKLALSREYHYDQSLVNALKSKKLLLMKNRTMLTEFSGNTPFASMDNAVTQLTAIGIRPLIAHMERYDVIQQDISLAGRLAAKGALIQVNAGSLLGLEGAKQKKTVKKLIKQDLVFAVASDAHDTEFRTPNLEQCEKYLIRKYGEEYACKVLRDNPMQLMP